jgi:hypothetical protein
MPLTKLGKPARTAQLCSQYPRFLQKLRIQLQRDEKLEEVVRERPDTIARENGLWRDFA